MHAVRAARLTGRYRNYLILNGIVARARLHESSTPPRLIATGQDGRDLFSFTCGAKGARGVAKGPGWVAGTLCFSEQRQHSADDRRTGDGVAAVDQRQPEGPHRIGVVDHDPGRNEEEPDPEAGDDPGRERRDS